MEAISTSWLPKLFCQTMIYPVNINLLTIAICNTNYQNIFICKCLLVLAIQDRSHQIWSNQVGSVCTKMLYPRGVWGHAPYEIASETIFWANTMLFGGQTTEFHMNAILPIASYTNGVDFRCSLLIGRKPHPLQVKLCETSYHSLVTTESCWKEDSWDSSVAVFAAISQLSTW